MKLNPFDILPRKIVLVFIQPEQNGFTLTAGKIQPGKSTNVRWVEFESAEALVKAMGKHFPYVLHINGFGVLTRVVENAPNFREGLLVSGNESEFYFTDYALKGKVAVSFVRKSLIAEVVKELEVKKVFLQGVFVGPIPLLPAHENYTSKGEYLVEVKNGELIRLERNGNEFPIGLQDAIRKNPDDALFATAIEGYHQGLDEETLTATNIQYKEYLRFTRLGLGVIIFFLVTLVSNYFYVNHLNQRAADMESEISTYGPNFSMIDQLQQEKSRKLMLIENSGIQSKHYISFYLDEIGMSVPGSISLSKLETFPLKEPLKPKKKMELDTELIRIEGQCANSKILDDWMEALETKKWVSSVELINYIRLDDKLANFELKLNIRK